MNDLHHLSLDWLQAGAVTMGDHQLLSLNDWKHVKKGALVEFTNDEQLIWDEAIRFARACKKTSEEDLRPALSTLPRASLYRYSCPVRLARARQKRQLRF